VTALASLVIAAYNAEATLGEALASALAQDYEPLEVMLVDDGSTDGTAAVAAGFPSVRCIQQPNAGPSAARNRGLREAHGEFVGFLDADDVAPPDKLSRQVGYLLEHTDVGCVLGRQELLAGSEAPPADTGVPLMSLVARRRILIDAGGFDEELRHAEDRDLLVRLRERGVRIEFLPDVVLLRRFHGANLSSAPPAVHPIFGSLKAKLDRSRPEQG
jgi:glycosyltransferase involved in cell wall biosynthesis